MGMNTQNQNKFAVQVIDLIGGVSKTARLCEVKPPSVHEWKSRGIPKARLMYLRLARPDVFKEIKKTQSE
jgi:hypothetical protein